MSSSTLFFGHDRKLFLTAVLVLFFPTLAAAQDSLRGSVYGKTKTPNETAKKTAPIPKKKFTAARKPARVAVRPEKKALPKPTKAELLAVTFTGREPMIEIWLNDKNIGATGEQLQFSKKLAPGEYRLMAKNKNQVLLPPRKITVGPEQTSFKLYVEPPPEPVAAPVVAAEPEKTEKTDSEVALEISRKVKAILETYADPATTDTVTTDDWQLVFQAAQLGQLAGYTAVQIEAQRWFASGQIELAKNEHLNALTAFNKAQEFMPTSALPFYGLGNTYLANNQPAEALKFYARALQLDPKLAMAHKKLGDTQRQLEKSKEALAAYQAAVKYGYQTPETRYWVGALMLEGKQIEEALVILETVARELPRAEVFVTIGEGYEKLKRDVSAIEFYRKAIEVDQNSAVAHYKLANVYFDQRELGKAKECYEKAIALDPKGRQVNVTAAQKRIRETTKTNR
jgi:tetratricopeptide (TPR) repeat protein